MKSEFEIRNRLKNLRIRYTKKFIEKSQKQLPHNCVFNYEHFERIIDDRVPIEYELSPRINKTLVMIQPELPVRLCTYGSENLTKWNGDIICDSEDVSKNCSWFKSKKSEEEAIEEFKQLVSNDDLVFKNYPDIAAIQWVLGEKSKPLKITFFSKLYLLFNKFCNKIFKPKSKTLELPGDLWQ